MGVAPRGGQPPAARPRAGRAPGFALAGVVFAWSLVPLSILVAKVLDGGGVLSGSDGMLAGADQQLYLAEIRDAGSDLLISNEYRLGPSDGVFLHPMFALSGLLWRLGLDIEASLWIWKLPVAIAIGLGVWAFMSRFLAGTQRWAGAALAIFFYSPVLPLLLFADVELSALDRLLFEFASGETMAALQTWGYLHAALVIGLMPLAVLAVERVVDPARRAPGRSRGWYLAWASATGLVAGWIHPWQGGTLIAIMAGIAVWGRFERRYLPLAIPAAVTAAPIGYELLLSRLDHDWVEFSAQNMAMHAPAWIVAAALLPLAIPAAFGLRLPARAAGERMLLLWAPVALVIYFATDQFPYHAFQGVAIPLAVLAVRGWSRLRVPALAGAVCVGALTLPGMIHVVSNLRTNVDSGAAPYIFEPEEHAALEYLEGAPREGGVLTRSYLGAAVPVQTGRDTWVGQTTWTPDFFERVPVAEELFGGLTAPADARRFVRSLRPAYVLTDCQQPDAVGRLLGRLVTLARDFGCARVYEVTGR